MTLEITTSLKGSPSPDTSSRETNHQCDLAQPISTPSTADITFRMVDLNNRTHRIASHRIASHRDDAPEDRKCGTQDGSRDFLGISRVFASPTRRTEKKVDSKIFSPLLFDPLLHPSRSRSAKLSLPSPSDVSSHRSSFPRSRFSQPVIPLTLYFSFTSLSPTLYLLSLVQIRIHVHTRTHTCMHPLHFDSVLVTGLCFNIYDYYL